MDDWIDDDLLPEGLGEGLDAIVVVLDCDANIARFNEYAEKLTGYRAIDVVGKNWFDVFIPGGDHEEIMEIFQDVWRGKDLWNGTENPIRTKAGSELLIRWENIVLRGTNGRTVAILSIGRDVTEKV